MATKQLRTAKPGHVHLPHELVNKTREIVLPLSVTALRCSLWTVKMQLGKLLADNELGQRGERLFSISAPEIPNDAAQSGCCDRQHQPLRRWLGGPAFDGDGMNFVGLVDGSKGPQRTVGMEFC